MDRLSFYNYFVTSAGVQEFDYLNNTLADFQMNYPTTQYLVTDVDLQRPDLISYSVYNTVEYWWIIAYVNQIQNNFTDLISGSTLTIPSLLDIYAFIKKYHRPGAS